MKKIKRKNENGKERKNKRERMTRERKRMG
jgi:hypothetical protein